MSIHIKPILACSLILLFILGCITPYEPGVTNDTAGILVVEGMILEPTGTFVKLSRTIPLSSDGSYESVGDARVKVIDDNGKEYILEHQHSTPGMYICLTPIQFEKDKQYAVDIMVGSRHYRSDFTSPVYTPEIEKLDWKANEEGTMVDIQVSAHDPENKVKYYRWVYEEDWEIISDQFTSYYWDAENKYVRNGMDIMTSFNRFYCWGNDRSKTFILGSSEKYENSKIKDNTILRHQASDMNSRFSYLYSICVKQYGISLEAYTYFQNLQKNIDEAGSIFAPLPTEMEGNIKCIEYPDEPVIGFIVATTEKTSRLYIDKEDVPEMRIKYFCSNTVLYKLSESISAAGSGLEPIAEEWKDGTLVGYYWMEKHCVNCLSHPGGTKNKPEWWPNNHL